jgi:hypothetical protein
MDVHRADPSTRRTAVLLLVLTGISGAALLTMASTMPSWLEAWVREDAQARITIVIAVLIVIAAGPPLALAMFLWNFGRRVVAAARFPPPDARLVQDMPVIVGAAARQRGRTLQVFAAGVAVSALLIVAALVRFALLVRDGAR